MSSPRPAPASALPPPFACCARRSATTSRLLALLTHTLTACVLQLTTPGSHTRPESNTSTCRCFCTRSRALLCGTVHLALPALRRQLWPRSNTEAQFLPNGISLCHFLASWRMLPGSCGSSKGYAPHSITYKCTPQDQTSAALPSYLATPSTSYKHRHPVTCAVALYIHG